MKYPFFVLFHLFLALYGTAQTYNLPLAKEINPIQTLVSTTDNCFYLLADAKNKKRFSSMLYKIKPDGTVEWQQNFDKALGEAFKKHYDTKENGLPLIPLQLKVYEYQSHLYYFIYGLGCNEKLNHCNNKTFCYFKLDKNQATLPEFVLEHEFPYQFDAKSLLKTGLMESVGASSTADEWQREKLIASPDGSKIALVDGECLTNSAHCQSEAIITNVMDLKEGKSYSWVLPKSDVQMDKIENFVVGDDGKIYVLGYLNAAQGSARQCVLYQIDPIKQVANRIDMAWSADAGLFKANATGKVMARTMSKTMSSMIGGPKGLAVNKGIVAIDKQNKVFIFGAKMTNGWKLEGYVFTKIKTDSLLIEKEQDVLFATAADFKLTENGKLISEKWSDKMKRFLFTDFKVTDDGQIFVLFDEEDPQTFKNLLKSGFSVGGILKEAIKSNTQQAEEHPFFPRVMLMRFNADGLAQEAHIIQKTKGTGSKKYPNKPSFSLTFSDDFAHILSPTQYYSRTGVVADVITYNLKTHTTDKYPLDYPSDCKVPKHIDSPLLGGFPYKGKYYTALHAQFSGQQGLLLFVSEKK